MHSTARHLRVLAALLAILTSLPRAAAGARPDGDRRPETPTRGATFEAQTAARVADARGAVAVETLPVRAEADEASGLLQRSAVMSAAQRDAGARPQQAEERDGVDGRAGAPAPPEAGTSAGNDRSDGSGEAVAFAAVPPSLDAVNKEAQQTRLRMAASIKVLRARKRELDEEQQVLQGGYDENIRQKEFAELRRQATHDARDLASELLRESEVRLSGVRRELPTFRKAMNDLSMQALIKAQDVVNLNKEQSRLRKQRAKLVDIFQRRGLGHWAESVLRQRVNPFVGQALVEGSMYVAVPVMQGLGRAAALESSLTRRLGAHVPLDSSPFYAGLVTAFVSLFPAVVIVSIVMKVKRSLSQLTIRHYTLLGCIYFTALSTSALVAWAMTSVDVLVHLQGRGQGLYDFAVIVQGLLYALYCIAHVTTSAASGDKSSCLLSAAVIAIGAHFFSHSTAHLRRGERPHVEIVAYALYSACFLAATHHVIMSSRKRPKPVAVAPCLVKQAVRLGREASVCSTQAMRVPSAEEQRRRVVPEAAAGRAEPTEPGGVATASVPAFAQVEPPHTSVDVA
jgi:hypothetical protein